MKRNWKLLILIASIISLYTVPVFADTDDIVTDDPYADEGDTSTVIYDIDNPTADEEYVESDDVEFEENEENSEEDENNTTEQILSNTGSPGILENSSGNGFLSIKCYVEDGLIGNASITLMDMESFDETNIDLYYTDYFTKTVPLKPGKYKVITGGFINDYTHKYPFSILNTEYIDITPGTTALFECALGNTAENPLGTEISEKVIVPNTTDAEGNKIETNQEPVGTPLDEAYKAGLVDIEEEETFPFAKVGGIILFLIIITSPFIYIFWKKKNEEADEDDGFLF